VINNTDYYLSFSFGVELFSFFVIFKYYLESGYFKEYLKVFEIILFTFIIINIFTQLFYPSGLYIDTRNWKAWFLGNPNSFIFFNFTALTVSTINSITKEGKMLLSYYFKMIVIIASEIIGNSVTGTIAIIITVVLVVFFNKSPKPKYKLCRDALLGSIAVSAILISVGADTSIGKIIVSIFNKTTTFSGRTTIWNSSVQKIQEHLLIGNGWAEVPLNWRWNVEQCHNTFLDILFVGGIVLFAIYIVITIFCLKRLDKKESSIPENVMAYIFIGYCVVFLMEARRKDFGIFILYALMFYAPKIKKYIEEKQQ
jgi:O-antigen ligase